MPAEKPAASPKPDLLEYDSRFKLLVCLSCKYAVQPTAISGHLLRHKIFRGDRTRLLTRVSGLQLLEPDDVELPMPKSSPVQGLPVVSGLKCTHEGCSNLCVSDKRMRRHWSEYHGVKEPDNGYATEVQLQTFFRGTKLRYFEVTSRGAMSKQIVHQSDEGPGGNDANAMQVFQAPTSLRSLQQSLGLDLEALQYFHHFSTQTSLTLPTSDNDTQYWQIDIVSEALRHHWPMHGLLAVSACHSIVLAEGNLTRMQHQDALRRFLRGFREGWHKMKDTAGVQRQRTTCARLSSILHWFLWRCGFMGFRGAARSGAPAAIDLSLLIKAIQGCADSACALQFVIDVGVCPKVTETAPSSGIMPTDGFWDGHSNLTASDLLNRLHTLPSRMTQVLGKPDNIEDVFVTLSAIEDLANYCGLGSDNNDRMVAWTRMVSWLQNLPSHFQEMLLQESHAALVVFAHWTVLLEDAELHYWFLKGSAAMVRSFIARQGVPDLLQA